MLKGWTGNTSWAEELLSVLYSDLLKFIALTINNFTYVFPYLSNIYIFPAGYAFHEGRGFVTISSKSRTD